MHEPEGPKVKVGKDTARPVSLLSQALSTERQMAQDKWPLSGPLGGAMGVRAHFPESLRVHKVTAEV